MTTGADGVSEGVRTFDAAAQMDESGRLAVWLDGLKFGMDVESLLDVQTVAAPAPPGWAAVRLCTKDDIRVFGLSGAPDPAEFEPHPEPFAFATRSKWPLAEAHPKYVALERDYRQRHGLDASS